MTCWDSLPWLVRTAVAVWCLATVALVVYAVFAVVVLAADWMVNR